MRVLFDGGFSVDYGQGYVQCRGAAFDLDLHEAFYGQTNGLCGASTRGLLWLVFGLEMATVSLRIEAHASPPPVDDTWDEIVEVSYQPVTTDVVLLEWGGTAYDLDLPATDYRVRYCASELDAAHRHNTPVSPYLLQFWPAPPESDRVVKQTGETAAYWHRFAETVPPPKTPQQKEEERGRLEDHAVRTQRFSELHRWQDLPTPSEPLLRAGGHAADLARLDRRLVDAIASAGADVQEAIPHWLATKDLPSGPHVIAMFVSRDPLRGALDAIYQAAIRPETDQRTLFAEIRQHFDL